MSKPTDKLLRDAAPECPPSGEYRHTLKVNLQKRFIHQRRRKLLTRSIGIFSLLLAMILVLNSSELRHRDQKTENLRGIMIERQNVSRETGELSKVEGWTIGGTTSFQATYKSPDPEIELVTLTPESPLSIASEIHVKFRLEQADSCLQMVSAGRATFLGTEDLHIDGIPVHFRKWLIRSQTWGVVVYWQGAPLTVPGKQTPS